MAFKIITARYREYISRLQNYLLDKKIIPGHENYLKFFILSRSRSGSNFLVNLLNSHDRIKCFSELFSRGGETYWNMPGFGSKKYNSDYMKHMKEADPTGFLTRYIYRRQPMGVSAVGFKLFYNQAKKGNASKLWSYLSGQDDIRVIHLKRKNMLNVVVSKKFAEASNEWVRRGKSTGENKLQIDLSCDECLEQFEKTKKWQQEADKLFASHAVLEVFYEDLVADVDHVMKQIQQFLGVNHQKLIAGTKKQSTRSLPEVIGNYDQLKACFEGSEWEAMFEK